LSGNSEGFDQVALFRPNSGSQGHIQSSFEMTKATMAAVCERDNWIAGFRLNIYCLRKIEA